MRYQGMKRLIFTLLMCWCLTAAAQNVTISGRTNKSNSLVRLFTYDELLTATGNQAATTQSDDKGFFILECTIKKTLSARIFIGLEDVDLFITPNATYDVEIIVPEQDNNVSYFDKEHPTLRIKRASDKGISRQLFTANEIINTYLIDHFAQIYRGRQTRYLDSIQAAIDKEMPDIKSDFVKSHIRYKIASIRLAINTDGGKKVIGDYFDGQKPLYVQPAYMELFKELFGNYFNKSQYDIHVLNDAFLTGPAAFKEYLDTDPFMKRNPCLAELITIYNLQQLCNADAETRYYAKAHLEQIRKNTAYSEHRAIIDNIFARQNRLAPGTDATDFELNNTKGGKTKLSDYKNELVLIQFVDGYSPVSERQFSRLQDLHHQWQDSVQIITISTKDKVDFYKKQFDEKHYDWPLLNLGNDILLLEAYNVKTFPEYILVKRGSKIAEAPAPSPEQAIETHVKKLYKK